MSNLATAPARARKVAGPKKAAELYNDLEHELALGDNEEDYEAGEQALEVLEERFPDVKAAARNVTEPPKLSRRAGAALRVVDDQEEPEQEPEPQERHGGRVRTRVSRATRIQAHRGARARRVSYGSRAWRDTGIPAAAESTSQLIMRSLGGLAGLSLLYLMVKGPPYQGASALSTAGAIVDKSLAALVDPHHDPIGGLGGQAIQAANVMNKGAQNSAAVIAAPVPTGSTKVTAGFLARESQAAAAAGHPGVVPPASVFKSGNADTIHGPVGPMANWLKAHGYTQPQIAAFESTVY